MSPRLHRTGCPCIGTDLEDLCPCTVPALFTHTFEVGPAVMVRRKRFDVFMEWHIHPKLGNGVLLYMPDNPRHLKPSRPRRVLATVSRWGHFGWRMVRTVFVMSATAIVIGLLAADFMGGGR